MGSIEACLRQALATVSTSLSCKLASRDFTPHGERWSSGRASCHRVRAGTLRAGPLPDGDDQTVSSASA